MIFNIYYALFTDNRTNPTLSDLQYAFNEMKISLPELEEYYNSVDSLPFPDKLPALPVHRPSELNLLKPGSKEIISRPLYIHEHLPPMIADQEGMHGLVLTFFMSSDWKERSIL